MKYCIADASGMMSNVLYNDLNGMDEFYIINKENLCLFYRIVLSYKLRKYSLFNFLRRAVYKKLFFRYSADETVCFYFGIFWLDYNLFKAIKVKYPKSKLVFHFHDTIASKNRDISFFDINKIKDQFDLVYTYNADDAHNYNLLYMPDMYSMFQKEQLKEYPHSDVVFIGACKDRLKLILEIYDLMTSYGLKCWFYIVVNQPVEENCKRENIYYSTKYLPFKEVLGRHCSSECILEITQQGCNDSTLRFWDAVIYNKKLITNCSAVKSYKYFDKRFICVFDKTTDINLSFFKNNKKVDFHYENDVSPITLFSRITRDLKDGN